MRIIIITVFTFLTLGVLVLMARIWGLSQTFPAYQHAFFAGAEPILIVKTETLTEAQEAVKARPDVVLWLDVRVSKDRVAFVLAPSNDNQFIQLKQEEQAKRPTEPLFTGGKIAEYDWQKIQEVFPLAPLLTDFYKELPTTRFIINVIDNTNEVHRTVVDELEKVKADNRTLVQSDTLVILTAIKELKPTWLYGTSLPDIMRLLTFDSLYILPTTQLMGDVFIAPLTHRKRPAINDHIVEEMRRRKKRIYLGPLNTEEDFALARKYKAEGYIADDLPTLLKFAE